MSYAGCPVEGCDGRHRVRLFLDGDGDGVFTRSWVDGEIVESECAHELTSDEVEIVIQAAIEAGPSEPDYD